MSRQKKEHNKKKVVFFSNTAESLWRFRAHVLQACLARGLDVYCIAAEDKYVDKLHCMGIQFCALPLSRSGINPVSELYCFIRLFILLRRINPLILWTYSIKANIYGSVAAFLNRVDSIAVITGLGYSFLNNSITARLARVLFKRALWFPRELWVLNDEIQNVLLPFYLKSPRKIVLLPGEGVDTDYFSPRKKREGVSLLSKASSQTLSEDAERVRFLMIARLLKDKGVYEYCTAAQRVRDAFPAVSFALLGPIDKNNPSGISKDEQELLCALSGVDYLGVSDDVRTQIMAADCVVLPSYSEGLPRVLLEASAMECPVISTDIPGARALVLDGHTGFLCLPRDAKALEACFLRFLKIPDTLRAAMGKEGRARVLKLSSNQRVWIYYEQLLTTVLREKVDCTEKST